MTIPKRTNETELTDDELMLFDFMFDVWPAFGHLQRDSYRIHMNCSYSHGLDDEALQSTLRSLLARGLVRHKVSPDWLPESEIVENTDYYTLSKAGGDLWERERRPDWSRFLHWTAWSDEQWNAHVVCADPICGRRCMEALSASGLIPPIERVQQRSVRIAGLVSWKSSSKVTLIRAKTVARTEECMSMATWDAYESMRCWWRDIRELDTLRAV